MTLALNEGFSLLNLNPQENHKATFWVPIGNKTYTMEIGFNETIASVKERIAQVENNHSSLFRLYCRADHLDTRIKKLERVKCLRDYGFKPGQPVNMSVFYVSGNCFSQCGSACPH